MSKQTLIHDDLLKWLEENRAAVLDGSFPKFHAVFGDPPYFLGSIVKRFGGKNAAPAQFGTDGAFKRASAGFMNKIWDGFDSVQHYQAWVTAWAEPLLDFVYPGAVLAMFGGTRTYHRVACGLEDAGWEVTDSIMCWNYGSGFPKSANIGKLIDKAAGAEREVVGKGQSGATRHVLNAALHPESFGGEFDITAPTTDAAKQWNGHGTALKPSYEPIVIARAPRGKYTYAELATKFGSGALNIDGSRIVTQDERSDEFILRDDNQVLGKGLGGGVQEEPGGRFPANTIFSCECEGDTHEPNCPIAILDTGKVDLASLSMYNIDKQEINQCCVNASSAVASLMLDLLTSNEGLVNSAPENVEVPHDKNLENQTLGVIKPKMADGIGNGANQEVENSTVKSKVDGYGNKTSEPFLTVTKSITKTLITRTMTCPTCNSSLHLSMTIYTGDSEKTTESNQTESRPEDVKDAINISHLISSTRELTGRMVATVSLVPKTRLQSGEIKIGNTTTPTCENITEEENQNRPSRFFYTAKASAWERSAGLDEFVPEITDDGREKSIDNPYLRGETERRNTHPTVKPIQICRYISNLLLPPELDTPRRILVPFSGSGSEMIGAHLAGWEEIVGVEREAEYVAINNARRKWWTGFSSYEQAQEAYKAEHKQTRFEKADKDNKDRGIQLAPF